MITGYKILTGFRKSFFLAILILLGNCIDPYVPKLGGYGSVLVVEGLITDQNISYTVKLSRTITGKDDIPEKVSGATMYVSDNQGMKTDLKEFTPGIYKTDSSVFRGSAGKYYTLHIITSDDQEYQSESCFLEPVGNIDSLFIIKDQEIINNGTETADGVRILLNSEKGTNDYYRWSFEEEWKFRVPNVKKYNYINEETIIPLATYKEYCWKKHKSGDVLIKNIDSDQGERIENQSVNFIATSKSDRLLLQYSILVKQFSISKNEYDFWTNMKKVNESGDDIFASQPFPVISNIHCVSNPGETVLGYFQVSAVQEKRMNISLSDVLKYDLKLYDYPCKRIEKAPEDYPSGYGPPLTWDGLYEMFCVNNDYIFVEPRYASGSNVLQKLVFSIPECSDCELTGSIIMPDYWIW